jgi:hypothetical protein
VHDRRRLNSFNGKYMTHTILHVVTVITLTEMSRAETELVVYSVAQPDLKQPLGHTSMQ